MDSLKITYQDPATLKPRATNPRTHSKKQIRQIADSIDRFGFTNPVLIDGTGTGNSGPDQANGIQPNRRFKSGARSLPFRTLVSAFVPIPG